MVSGENGTKAGLGKGRDNGLSSRVPIRTCMQVGSCSDSEIMLAILALMLSALGGLLSPWPKKGKKKCSEKVAVCVSGRQA